MLGSDRHAEIFDAANRSVLERLTATDRATLGLSDVQPVATLLDRRLASLLPHEQPQFIERPASAAIVLVGDRADKQ